MTPILAIDYWIFLLFNKTLANPFFDVLMPFITKSSHILIFLISLGVLYPLLAKDKVRALKAVLIATLLFGLTDSLAYRVIKPTVKRWRPCNPMYFNESGEHAHLPGGNFFNHRKGSYSFPSNHAVNIAAQSTFWAVATPVVAPLFIAYGVMICYSRVYVGVHYPLDVFIGAVLGVLLAWLVWRWAREWVGEPTRDE